MKRLALIAALAAVQATPAAAFYLAPVMPLSVIDLLSEVPEEPCPEGQILDEDINTCMSPEDAQKLAERELSGPADPLGRADQ